MARRRHHRHQRLLLRLALLAAVATATTAPLVDDIGLAAPKGDSSAAGAAAARSKLPEGWAEGSLDGTPFYYPVAEPSRILWAPPSPEMAVPSQIPPAVGSVSASSHELSVNPSTPPQALPADEAAPVRVAVSNGRTPLAVPSGGANTPRAEAVAAPPEHDGARIANGGADEAEAEDEDDEDDEDDEPLLLLRPLGDDLHVPPPPPPLVADVDYPIWVPPEALATAGPLRTLLVPALSVSQDIQIVDEVGYTIRTSTAADLPQVADAFVAAATADGNGVVPAARDAVLAALRLSAVKAMHEHARPLLTAAQWAEAATLDPGNEVLASEAAARARRGAVRIGLPKAFDGAARPLYDHQRGEEHTAPLLGALLRMIRPTVVVERGGGSYTTAFLLQALADNAADFTREAEDAASAVGGNFLRPFYFDVVQQQDADGGADNALLRRQGLSPVLHCLHNDVLGSAEATGLVEQLGLDEKLLHVHDVAAAGLAAFAPELADHIAGESEAESDLVDLLWFGEDEPGIEGTDLEDFVDAYVPLLKRDQGYFAVQSKYGYLGPNYEQAFPWANGVNDLHERIRTAANPRVATASDDELQAEGSKKMAMTALRLSEHTVDVEMISLLEPHKWRAGSLTLFKLSQVGTRAPLGQVLFRQQIKSGYEAMARQAPDEAAAHFVNGIRVAQRYGLKTADAEFGHGVALTLADKQQQQDDSGTEVGQLSAVATTAMAAFTRTIESDAMHAPAHHNLANLLVRDNRPTEAIEHLEAAIDAVPSWPKAYATWGKIYATAGDHKKERGVYETALSNGVAWGSVNQRPERFLRGLPAQEFWDPSEVTLWPSAESDASDGKLRSDWVAVLEKEWEPIRDEVLAVLARAESDDKPADQPEAGLLLGLPADVVQETPGLLSRRSSLGANQTLSEEEQAGRGMWRELRMLDEGRPLPAAVANFPHTMKTVTELLGDDPLIAGAGVVKASWLAPGARIVPHCGPHNLRLRLHLGLMVPERMHDGAIWHPSAGIRVGNATVRSWEEGKAMIFDESFEHGVYNIGSTARLVLIVDVWHPALEMEKRSQLLALRERWKVDERSYITHPAWW